MLPLESSLTIVGPNNTGKTSLLRSILLFFIGHDNDGRYDVAIDKPFSGGNVKTSMVATFEGDDSGPDSPDWSIYQQLDKLLGLYERSRGSSSFTLNLVFSPSGVPVYQFFPNLRKPRDNSGKVQISRLQRQLVTDLLGKFAIHYVPSAKNVTEIYEEVLTPFLRRVAQTVIQPHVAEIRRELQLVSSSITAELQAAGLKNISTSFDLPKSKEFLSGFDFNMSDPYLTPIFSKGLGIQTTAILASFSWVTDEEAKLGKSSIWLLEEPESYLHPELTTTSRSILGRLSEKSLVVTSTHSLSFVPQDPSRTVGTELTGRNTNVVRFTTYAEATAALRKSLGVRFSDYFNLTEFNILVEGPTDREAVDWFLAATSDKMERSWPRLRAASILDFGGVRGLGSFVRATFSMIRDERAAVCIFDGDPAGDKERRDLNQFFGQKSIPFQSGQDYLVVRDRFALEGLFPDEWIIDAGGKHATWFVDISTDVSGNLLPFQVKDAHKRSLLGLLMRTAESSTGLDWAKRWIALMDAAETALTWHEQRLSSNTPTTSAFQPALTS
ncbi:ATP-dependent nuclease [Amycolatopsis eburnea]|uniref:ATP-dependent nuclease n=1 Tax=Amycolatopsis eburnea TaxID=2267691 RepID=UPI0013151013|nr:AAA family ATPase [Amycolatopsis eburnea]